MSSQVPVEHDWAAWGSSQVLPHCPQSLSVAKEVSKIVPKGANVLVVDPSGTGESAKITYYYLEQGGTSWISAFTRPTLTNVKSRLNKIPNKNYVLIQSLLPNLS